MRSRRQKGGRKSAAEGVPQDAGDLDAQNSRSVPDPYRSCAFSRQERKKAPCSKVREQKALVLLVQSFTNFRCIRITCRAR